MKTIKINYTLFNYHFYFFLFDFRISFLEYYIKHVIKIKWETRCMLMLILLTRLFFQQKKRKLEPRNKKNYWKMYIYTYIHLELKEVGWLQSAVSR